MTSLFLGTIHSGFNSNGFHYNTIKRGIVSKWKCNLYELTPTALAAVFIHPENGLEHFKRTLGFKRLQIKEEF
jgi:hypothetical protein